MLYVKEEMKQDASTSNHVGVKVVVPILCIATHVHARARTTSCVFLDGASQLLWRSARQKFARLLVSMKSAQNEPGSRINPLVSFIARGHYQTDVVRARFKIAFLSTARQSAAQLQRA
jgi:hypothetical protein